jgi:hypothetical protein
MEVRAAPGRAFAVAKDVLHTPGDNAPATPAEVEAALAAEARALDATGRGTHVFEGIHPVANRRCNWSATYHKRGGALPLTEMRAALARVQARMPFVSFEPFLLNDR